jgi:hypothetical protein
MKSPVKPALIEFVTRYRKKAQEDTGWHVRRGGRCEVVDEQEGTY